MRWILLLWFLPAFLMWGFSMGLDAGCKREPTINNPIVFLAWPAAMVVLATGWESDKKDVCEL